MYYYGREERPNTGLAEISLLPPGDIAIMALLRETTGLAVFAPALSSN
jgi:hypothetical protein